jgi:hypothetical protein
MSRSVTHLKVWFDFSLLTPHNNGVVHLRSFIALSLIIGLLISLHGRVEAESSNHSHPSKISDHKDEDGTAPAGEALPLGAHKDRHGCYHSHAPFNVPATVSLSPISCSTYVTEATQPLIPTIAFHITHPPRA